MIVLDFLNSIKENPDYFPGSLYLKSSNNDGCVYKWLSKGNPYAFRKEVFVTLNPEESELSLENKSVLSFIEVEPAK